MDIKDVHEDRDFLDPHVQKTVVIDLAEHNDLAVRRTNDGPGLLGQDPRRVAEKIGDKAGEQQAEQGGNEQSRAGQESGWRNR